MTLIRARFPFLGVLLLWVFLMGSSLYASTPRTVVFFGDSLTAGYGLANPGAEAYPALIQEKIRAAGLGWKVVNAGLSGETTSGGLRRVDWILRQPVDLFVLALGANVNPDSRPIAYAVSISARVSACSHGLAMRRRASGPIPDSTNFRIRRSSSTREPQMPPSLRSPQHTPASCASSSNCAS